MRAVLIFAVSLLLVACGSSPKPVVDGPRLQATLEATWPAAAPARQTAFSRDGKLLALSDASGLITIRNAGDWKVRARLQHSGGATSLAFGSDSSRLFSAGYDGSIREWDLSRRKLVRSLEGAKGTVWTIDLSPDGSRLAAAGEDAIIRIWQIDKPRAPLLLRGHARNIWAVRFSPDGKRLASGSFDNSVRLWNVDNGRSLKTLIGHTQAVVGLDFSPDGKFLVTGGDDSTIRFWRASDGMPLQTIDNGTHVDKVAFSPDGSWIASGGHPHGTIGEIWHQLTGGGGSGDSVRLWRTKDGALVASLLHPDDVIWVSFSRDGQWLVTSAEDNRFRLWRLRRAG